MMKFGDLQAALQRDGLAPLYLIIGEEDYFRDRAISMIRKYALEAEEPTDQGLSGSPSDSTFSCEVLYGDETDAQDVLSRVEALSFFSNHRLVILKWAEKLSARDGEALIPYLQTPSTSSTLVLSAPKLDGRLKWVQTIKKRAIIVECAPLYENQRLAWVRSEATRTGIRLDNEAAHLLKDCATEGLYRVRCEIDKLALYVPEGGTVRVGDIQAIQGNEPGISVFELAGAIGKGQHDEALLILEKNLEAGEAPLRMLGALIWQFRRLWKVREALAQGLSASNATREAGIPPFRQQEFLAVVRQFELIHFRKAFELFAEVDRGLKRAAAGSSRRILSGLLISLCQQTKARQESRDQRRKVDETFAFTRT